MEKTEITVKCNNSLNEIKHILQCQNFDLIEKYQLNDWYFSPLKTDTLKELDYLSRINNSFLVREIVEEDKRLIMLTYKSKILDENGNVISEEKTKVEVSSLENSLNIFKKSGLNNWCEIKNTSYIFGDKTKPEIQLAIQCIENLGIFIEFEEFDSIQNLPPTQKFDTMKKIIQQYNLNLDTDFSVKKVQLMFEKTQNL